jgi:hypothetical protein
MTERLRFCQRRAHSRSDKRRSEQKNTHAAKRHILSGKAAETNRARNAPQHKHQKSFCLSYGGCREILDKF